MHAIIKTLLLCSTTALMFTTAHAAPISGLQERDLNGDGVADAYYDTLQNLTWLRDANFAKTSGHDSDGAMNWSAAQAWASSLSFGGLSDWRLPTMIDSGDPGCDYGTSGTDCGYNVRTDSEAADSHSELGHLFYVTLGNKGFYDPAGEEQADYGLLNIGGFDNFQTNAYWLGTDHAPDPDFGWIFDTFDGFQVSLSKDFELYAFAVRMGDVGASAVPEPASVLLMLAGLGGVAAMRRRRAHSPNDISAIT